MAASIVYNPNRLKFCNLCGLMMTRSGGMSISRASSTSTDVFGLRFNDNQIGSTLIRCSESWWCKDGG